MRFASSVQMYNEDKFVPELQEQYRYTFTFMARTLEEIMRIMSRIHPINYEFNDRIY